MCFTEKKDDFVCCICLSKNEYLDNYYNNNDTNYYSQSNLKTYKGNQKKTETETETGTETEIGTETETETTSVLQHKKSTFNKIIKLECGHQFHVNCIDKWINEKYNCPLCRNEFNYILYDFEESIQKDYSNIKKIQKIYNSKCYKYKFNINKIKNLYLNIDDKIVKISNAFQQLINQKPINYKINKSNIYYPVYFVFTDNIDYNNKSNQKIYISFYLRQLILWNKIDKTKIFHYTDSIGNKIFCSSQNISDSLTKSNFNICYEWIYEIMCEFKRLYKFNYYSELNTLILDIFVKTVKNYNNISKYTLQTVVIATLYNIIQLYYPNKFKHITKELLIEYTDNSSNIDDFNKFQFHQETKIINNININC